MKSSILVNGRQYISASRAAEITKYSRDYIGQLCRSGKIPSTMFLRSWFVDLDALINYRDETEKHVRLYNQNGGAVSASNSVDATQFKAVVFPEPKMPVSVTKKEVRSSSYIYSQDERPLLPILKEKSSDTTRAAVVRDSVSKQVSRELNLSKPHSAAFVALFMFIGASMAAAAYPNETWRIASSASQSVAETIGDVGGEIAKVSESVSDSLFSNTVSNSNQASVGSWLSSTGHSVVLAIRRILGIDDAPTNTNIFANESQNSTATSSVVYVYRQFPNRSGSTAQSTAQLQPSTVVYVPSSTGVSTSRIVALENNASYLTDQIGMLQNSQLDLRDFITQTVGQSISNAFRGVNFGGGTTVVNSGGGGSGTVTSVDVSGGTTGLSATGGPVTTSGTLTLSGVLNIANGGTGTSTAPTYGKLLLGNSSGGYDLVATSTIGLGGSSGTVSSVDASGGTTGLSFSGGAITTSGTLTLGGTLIVANGGTGLSSIGASSTILQSNGTSLVYQKLSPGLFTTANISQWTNDAGYLTSASVPAYPFGLTGNATSTLTQFNGGLTAYASSTIGNGTQIGGLTVNGGATTTGNVYVAGNFNASAGTANLQGAAFGVSGTQFSNNVNFGLNNATSIGTLLANNIGIGTTSPYRQLSVGNSAVFGDNVTAASFTSTSTATSTFAGGIDAARICITGTTKCLDTITNNTGSAYPFALAGNATSTLTQFNGGLTAYGTSTIGNGTQIGGLTVNGGATTTGNAYIAGNVGVGTISPVTKLEVTGSIRASGPNGNEALIAYNTAGGSTAFSADSSGAVVINGLGSFPSNTGLTLNSAGASWTPFVVTSNGGSAGDIFRISSNGNVGVGTTSPYRQLSVGNSGVFGGNVLAANFTSTSTIASVFPYASTTALTIAGSLYGANLTNCTSGNKLLWADGTFSCAIDQTGGGTGGGTWSTTTSTVNGQFVNYSNNSTDVVAIGNNSTTSAKFFFDPNVQVGYISGRLGIGTTSPSLPLSVQGNAIFSGNLSLAGLTATGTVKFAGITGSNQCLHVDTNGLLSGTGSDCGAGGASFGQGWDIGSKGYIGALSPTTTIGIGVSASSTIGNGLQAGGLTINGGATTTGNAYIAGNVGIGTASPQAKLQVSGGSILLDNGLSLAFGAGLGSIRGGDTSGGFVALQTNSGDRLSITHLGDAVFTDESGNNLLNIKYDGKVGIGTSSPYAALSVVGASGVVASKYTATSTTATSTFAGGLDVGNGGLAYDFTTGITSIASAVMGSLSFDTDAGLVSWTDLPVSSAIAGTPEGYIAYLAGNPAITVYGTSTGSGNVSGPFVGIGTSTPSAFALSVQGSSLVSGNLNLANLLATGTLTVSGTGTSTFTGGLAATSASTTATSTMAGINLPYGGCVAVAGVCLTTNTGNINSGVLGQLAFYGASGTTLSGSSTASLTMGRYIATSTIASNFLYASTTAFTASGAVYLATSGGKVGIGTTTPFATLSVNTVSGVTPLSVGSSTGSYLTVDSSGMTVVGGSAPLFLGTSPSRFSVYGGTTANLFQGLAPDGGQGRFSIMTNGDSGFMSPVFRGDRGRNTAASPSAVQNGDVLFDMTGCGWNTSTYTCAANIDIVAAETYTGSTNASYIKFSTTPSGSINPVEVFRIDSTGNLGVGTTSPYRQLSVGNSGVFGGNVLAANFTATSTSASTFPYASTTAISATSAFATNLTVSGLTGSTQCLRVNTLGVVSGTGSDCNSAGTLSPWATTTSTVAGQLINAPLNATDIVTVGTNSTTTSKFFFDPNQQIGYISGKLGIGTTTPAEKIDVMGNINISTGSAYKYNNVSVVTAVTGLSDYFFGAAGNTSMSGSNNIGVGLNALRLNVSGGKNIAMGTNALAGSDSGSSNLAFGYQSLINNFDGSGNVALGEDTLKLNVSGANNTALGYTTGNTLTGSNNLLLGALVGQNLTTGSNNIAIGYNINTPAAGSANTLNIGNLIYGTGIDGTGSTISTGKIGIGTTTPTSLLSINTTSGTSPFSVGSSTGSYFHINSIGNIGAGTSFPNNKLTVQTGTNAGKVEIGNLSDATSYGGIGFGTIGSLAQSAYSIAGNGSSLILNSTTGTLFNINNVGAAILTSGGNFGVGTSSPYRQLSVGNSAVFGDNVLAASFTATSTTATSSIAGTFSVGSTTPEGTALFAVGTSTSKFSVNKNTGFVGVGTTNPTEKLSVGSGTENNDISVSSVTGDKLFFSAFNDLGVLSVNRRVSDGVFVNSGLAAPMVILSSGNSDSNISFYTTTSNNTLPLERFRITSTGAIGIGTSTPTSLLSLQGNALFSGNLSLANLTATGTLTASSALFGGKLTVNASGLQTTSSNNIGITGGLQNSTGANVNISGLNTRNFTSGTGQEVSIDGAFAPTSGTGEYNALQVTGTINQTGGADGITRLLYLNPTVTNVTTYNKFRTFEVATGTSIFGGNVGIGTTSPYAKLSISNNVGDAANVPLFAVASTSAGLSTSTLFTVLANGKVGINTSSPSTNYRLDVQGATLINGAFDTLSHITLLNNSAVYFLRNGNSAISSNADGVIQFSNSSLGANATLVAGKAVFGSTTPLGILSVAATSSLSNIPLLTIQTPTTAGLATSTVFTVAANGNTGIGTTSPYRQLSVGSSAIFGDNVTAANFTATSTATSTFAGGIDAARICITGTTKCLDTITSGTGSAYPFGLTGNATSTLTQFNGGITAYASSTIGNGTQAGGLTVSGGATTTGSLLVNGAGAILGGAYVDQGIYVNCASASTDCVSTNGVLASGNVRLSQNYGGLTYFGTSGASLTFPALNAMTLNTGPGTGYLNFITNGAGEAARIIDNGNFGIGTTTPQRKLWVTNNGSNAQIALEDTGATANNHYGSLSYSRGRFSFNVMNDALASTTRLTIDSNGNVGIGTTTPYAALSVVGASGVVADKFYATSTTATSTFAGGLNVGNGGLAYDFTTGITSIASARMGNLSFEADAGLVTWTDLPVVSATAGTPEGYTAFLAGNPAITVYGTSTGAGAVTSTMVGIATTTPWRNLSVNGTVSMVGLTTMAGANGNAICLSALNEVVVNTGAQTCTLSSGRFKHDIASSTSGLDTIMALNPVTFYYNADAENKDQQFGFIAEDVQKVDPRLVALDSEGKPQTVRYEEFTAILAKAIQEQQIQLVSLKTNASSTASTLDTLTSAVNSIGSGSSVSQTVVVQPDTSSTTLALAAAVQVLQGQVISLQIDSASTSAAIAAINNASTSEEVAQTVSVNLASSTSFIQVIASSVQSLIQSAGEWVVAKITATLAVFNRVETQTAAVTKGLEMTDQATGQIYCVVIKNGDFAKIPGTCETMATSTPAIATTTAPVIAPITTPVVPVTNNTPNPVTVITSTSTTQAASSTPSEQAPVASSSPATTTTPAAATSTDPVVIPPAPTDTSTTTPTPTPTPTTPTLEPAAPTPTPEPAPAPTATDTTTTTP